MEALMTQAIRDTATFRKTSVPWTLDEPYTQAYYGFDPATSTWVKSPLSSNDNDHDRLAITAIALYTWNIDFMLPFAAARMRPALAHLHQLTHLLPPNVAPVIFLQECTRSDLETIAATPWVRAHFHLTDIDTANWATTQYGTTVLVSRHLPITSVFRVHYSHTRMDRDALFVDVSTGLEEKRIRLCNTHLESMALDPPYRPPQVQLVAQYMHHDGVDAALAAGDFNAIQPFDRTLHVDNDLKDAFLELGGEEDTEDGYTWGQQAATKQRAQFGCSRMDKVYFRGSLKLLKFERFGEDILAEGDEERRQIVNLGFEKPWVTDHLGVMAVLDFLPSTKGQL
ncbi:endonuclease/exonuclease/phosphatase family protein [Aspergillus bombycis]|uniref:Endonuclease/exonuclease/phosphatase family protein n=1 Tax=Aspergillus bombycis TaxID=109264 RepID=A0A1F8A503_9EURO|nr:endonuclease/exonuclease/phosphatase family protein [Aspergillus bombycis]OGM46791.1 endonuclease/exonuclease/phosphatase family protein [Aspergillus bombycis]